MHKGCLKVRETRVFWRSFVFEHIYIYITFIYIYNYINIICMNHIYIYCMFSKPLLVKGYKGLIQSVINCLRNCFAIVQLFTKLF